MRLVRDEETVAAVRALEPLTRVEELAAHARVVLLVLANHPESKAPAQWSRLVGLADAAATAESEARR